MKHQKGYLKSNRATNVFYQYWLPENEPKAVLFVVHGLAEHSGRYMNLVNHFVPAGYAVYGIDHIGHGKSDGKRVYVERFRDFTKTLKIYFDCVRNWQPQTPIYLVGHSMGGLIGATYLLEHQKDFSGAILSGPGVKLPDHLSQITIWAGKILSVLMPTAGVAPLNYEGISRDPEVVAAYANDPLVYTGKITARLAAEMMKAIVRLADHAAKIRLPLLIAQGGCDTIVDPDGAQRLYDQVGSTDKAIKIYDPLYHEIFNEPEHETVLTDVQLWIESRCA
ncbi:MAG: lysophospholipase [Proteobacteria bacterium]|nr:lysophospholipase [Pseudomonadota bacterium]